MSTEFVLEMKDISKTFPGVKALDHVSIQVKPGSVHALMGENGAGKSTLMKCAFGLYHPDEGEILVDGKPAHYVDTRDAMANGISMIHQELHPICTQNVMENIWVGRIPYKKVAGIKWVDTKTMYDKTKALLADLGIQIDPRCNVGTLSVSHCQLIEIARSVSYGAKVIIMDEPTSSLTEAESELLFKIIKKLTGQGVAILYISHKIEEVLDISDAVTVMRDGKLIGTWPTSELDMNSIVAKMVGREMTNRFPEKKHVVGEPLLEVEHFTSADPKSFKDVSFTVHKGEVLGIGGLVGAQRTELMESVFGLRAIAGGTVKLKGKEIKIRCPQDAIQHGMALLTEERRTTGIVPMLSIMENTVLANRTAHTEQYRKAFFLDRKKMEADAQHYVDELETKTPLLSTEIQYLSGGNQQKVLLGRWLLLDPDVLILDEPTRGIDVGAKYEIYCLIEQMAQQGKCIIMISSEMPELIGMSDRIMVMCEGHKSGILQGDQITDQNIMYLASTYNTQKEGAAQ
jgi:methyl-galactoside transport system ATP-binding protein